MRLHCHCLESMFGKLLQHIFAKKFCEIFFFLPKKLHTLVVVLNEAQWSSTKVKGAQGADQGSSFELIGLMVGQNKE